MPTLNLSQPVPCTMVPTGTQQFTQLYVVYALPPDGMPNQPPVMLQGAGPVTFQAPPPPLPPSNCRHPQQNATHRDQPEASTARSSTTTGTMPPTRAEDIGAVPFSNIDLFFPP